MYLTANIDRTTRSSSAERSLAEKWTPEYDGLYTPYDASVTRASLDTNKYVLNQIDVVWLAD